MIEHIFPVTVARIDALLDAQEIAAATRLVIEADRTLNDFPVPYSRPDRTSLEALYPDVYGPIFAKVRAAAEAAYGVRVRAITGRESVFLDGQHLPVHVEGDSDLSALLWLDWTARPDPAKRDYNGMFCMQNPGGGGACSASRSCPGSLRAPAWSSRVLARFSF
ncbi:MAG: hypothetical protein MO847_11980, partial [Candidatus Protistobacter heckmanni]|nr:hypothetical protein [Candidatus Protistobacter heckmanni]